MTILFDMNNSKNRKEAQQDQLLLKHQCAVCPLKKQKKAEVIPPAFDVLIIGPQTPFAIGSNETGASTYYSFSRECGSIDMTADRSIQVCCMGRKLDLIQKHQPKVVVTLGAATTKLFEEQLGYDTGPYTDGMILPTRHKNHNFWLMPFELETLVGVNSIRQKIAKAMKKVPDVVTDYYSGLVNITRTEDIQRSFDILKASKTQIACDVETYPLRPYDQHAQLLSIALSDGVNTFSYPLFHPQTPDTFVAIEFFVLFEKFASEVELIFHNGPFDEEWLAAYMGEDFLYSNKRHDSCAQAYLINDLPNRGKKLDELTRRYLGFNIKKLSGSAVSNISDLRQLPIESCLKYNGLDAKYTHQVFKKQEPIIIEQELPYETQIAVQPAVVLIQKQGLVLNMPFIKAETTKQKHLLDIATAKFEALATVQRFKSANGGILNPASDNDIKKLFHNYLNVPVTQTSFDEPYLSTRKNCDVSKALLEVREVAKLYGTYLAKINPYCGHANAGLNIWPDGLVHCMFNTMRTATGRLSSDSPNMQNWPKKNGKVFLREAIMAPPGFTFVSIDFGQIEYRVIAALSKDPVMIQAINEGLDIHGWWATHLDSLFPGVFLTDPTDKVAFKEFRNKCKNCLVFPFCFGSTYDSVGENMGIKDKAIINMIGDEFAKKHEGVTKWQNALKQSMLHNGYIVNGFKRRFRAPLRPNQIINYPIQSTASDLVITAMSRLARQSVVEKIPYICPRINIHDDLSFYIPTEKLEEALMIILPTMLDTRDYEFLPVPLLAEVTTGQHWADQHELGTFSSETFYGIPHPLKAA